MIRENEILSLLLFVGILGFLVWNGRKLRQLPASSTLIAAFSVLLMGRILTVLEGFFWKDLLNVVEHVCYAGSALLVAVWFWRVFGKRGQV